MKNICDKNKCVGCRACVSVCSKNAIIIRDTVRNIEAVIDEDKCCQCGRCKNVCQVIKGVTLIPVKKWKQGWSNNDFIRRNSASGGMATAIIDEFRKDGGSVISCMYDSENKEFIMDVVDNKNSCYKVPGSKYVKSNPVLSYNKIQNLLINGKKVLFVGLPCQVYALKLAIPEKLQEYLFTIDLICHGTPSSKLLNKYCREHVDGNLEDIKFRAKDSSDINIFYEPVCQKGIADSYLISFIKALNYYESCYNCAYAGMERCSDITLGDSWGSNLPKHEQEKGISLILIQTKKGEQLLDRVSYSSFEVDIERAIKYNAQLRSPEKKPHQREIFLKAITSNKSYDMAVFRSFPILMLKQYMKIFLIRIKCYKFTGSMKYRMLVKRELKDREG